MIAVASENICGDQQVSPVSEVIDLQQLLQENRTLHCDRNYYKTLHEKAKEREVSRKAVPAMDAEIIATFPLKRRSLNYTKPFALSVDVPIRKRHFLTPTIRNSLK